MSDHTTAGPSISHEEVVRAAWEDEPKGAAELVAALAGEHDSWHRRSLNLVASHNLISPRAKAILWSDLVDNGASGAIGGRSHTGTVLLDRIETLLVELAKRLFGVPYVEHRAPSGALSNGLFFLGATEPGDRIMALPLKYGGHYTYREGGYPGARGLEISEIPCHGEDYPEVNLELLAQEVERVRPAWLVVGSATLLYPYPLEEMAEIAGSFGARIMYDGAHILGLAAGGQFQDPLHEGAAVMTGSTQKTLAGPVGGMVLMNDPEVDERVSTKANTLISSYNNVRLAALAVTLAEMVAYGKEYAQAVVGNAQALSRSLEAEGFRLAGKDRGVTQSHLVLVDLGTAPACLEALGRLEAVHISCSPASLPRTYPHKTALRLGSPVCTRRGMGTGEMAEVARVVRRAVLDGEDPARVGRDVVEMASSFDEVHYCF